MPTGVVRSPARSVRRRALVTCAAVAAVIVVLALSGGRIDDGDRGSRSDVPDVPDVMEAFTSAGGVPVDVVAPTGSPSADVSGAIPVMQLEEPEPQPVSEPYLARHRIVAYYGNPLAKGLGILGAYPPAEMIRRLRAQADVYAALSPDREVVPALHLIYAVAQANPGEDGLYLYRMDDELVRSWIALARDNGMLVFLDIQLGRSTVEREVSLVLPYLREPNVHLALDPEFAWSANELPLRDIGHLDAAQINRAQQMISDFAVEQALPNKVLVVHQFLRSMITRKDQITGYDRVELVIDMDGFGPPSTKLGSWNDVIRADNVQYAGIKLFYQQDAAAGGLMTEADVMALEPVPVVIIYQ